MIFTDDYDTDDGKPLPPAEAWRVWSILTLCIVIDITFGILAFATRGH